MTQNGKKEGCGRQKKSTSYIQRSVRVILPNMVRANEWKQLAKDSNLSMSKFIIKHVEESLERNGTDPQSSRRELVHQILDLQWEIRKLNQELEIKTRAYDALNAELKIIRIQPWMMPTEEGLRETFKNLIDLFRIQKRVMYHELLPALGVKPTDLDMVKGINTQIEILTKFGLIGSDLQGWRWRG